MQWTESGHGMRREPLGRARPGGRCPRGRGRQGRQAPPGAGRAAVVPEEDLHSLVKIKFSRSSLQKMLQEGLDYTLMDMVNRRAADKLAGRWHHQPARRAHSPPSPPPQSPPRPPLGHLCPRGPTLSAPPELPEGGGVPPVSVSGRGASLRVSSPEPGGPSVPETVPTHPPSSPLRLLPAHVPRTAEASGQRQGTPPGGASPLLPGSLHSQQGWALPAPPQPPDEQQRLGLQHVSPRPAPPSQSQKLSPPWKKETRKARYSRAHSTT